MASQKRPTSKPGMRPAGFVVGCAAFEKISATEGSKFVAAGIVGVVTGNTLASLPSQAEYGYRPVHNFGVRYG